MIIIDTSAWIEYFRGSDIGRKVMEYLTKEEISTPSIVLIELSCKSIKEGWDFPEHLKFIKSKSSIIGVNEKIIIKCGENYVKIRKKKPKFGIIDSIILTTATEINAKILTKDSDFRDMNEAVLL